MDRSKATDIAALPAHGPVSNQLRRIHLSLHPAVSEATSPLLVPPACPPHGIPLTGQWQSLERAFSADRIGDDRAVPPRLVGWRVSRDSLRSPMRVDRQGHAACFVTRPCVCPRSPGTLQALAHASVDLLAEEVALLARHATKEAGCSHAATVGACSQAVKDTIGSIRDDPRRRQPARSRVAARRMRAARETQPQPPVSRAVKRRARAGPACYRGAPLPGDWLRHRTRIAHGRCRRPGRTGHNRVNSRRSPPPRASGGAVPHSMPQMARSAVREPCGSRRPQSPETRMVENVRRRPSSSD